MRQTTRRTALVGTTAGLSLALLVPLAGPASAHDSGRQGRDSSPYAGGKHSSHDRHHWSHDGWHHRSNPAEKAARKALAVALKEARSDLRVALHSANKSYRSNAVVIDARADLVSVLRTATDPALILAAKQAYADAVAGPKAARDAAVDLAWTNYVTAVDAAYAVYDTAVLSPEEAAARAEYRTAVRDARKAFKADRKAAYTAFRTATSADYAALRASINLAFATYEASDKTWADREAFKLAVRTARTTFCTDADVVAAKAELRTAVKDARTEYRLALKDARDAFYDATGHYPKHSKHHWGAVKV